MCAFIQCVTEIYLTCKQALPARFNVSHPIRWNAIVMSYLIMWRASLQLHLSSPPPSLLRTRTHAPSTHLPHPRRLSLSSQPINQKCIKSGVGPIKGRIPGRRADKPYLINKCFTIAGARAPRHTLPASLWYLIIHPFHSVREGGEGRLTVSSQANTLACVRVYVYQDLGNGLHGGKEKKKKHIMTCSTSKCAESGTCKQMQIRCWARLYDTPPSWKAVMHTVRAWDGERDLFYRV